VSDGGLTRRLLVGVFVGGRGMRLGGVDKGLLKAPDSELTLIERLLGELRLALPSADTVLLGASNAYAHLTLPQLADAPQGVGPLGGLLALLEHAEQQQRAHVIALACDLPYIAHPLLARLATEKPEAAALIAETDGARNPLVARYAVAPASRAARAVFETGKRSLQAVLDALAEGVERLELTPSEMHSLRDWDRPEDLA
jgi:molybdopterin-guanine dinucleotide biosynthesis protein A